VSSKRKDVERAVLNRISVRETARTFGVSASAVSRHREHAGIVPDAVSTSGTQSHVATAQELIEAVKVIRGADFSAQDAAEAQQLLAIAQSADADPTVAAIRELRLTHAGFRRLSFQSDPSEAEEMAELVARLSPGRDGTYEKVYAAAIDAGATPEAAMAAATAAK
jgi:transposase-like protein